MTASGGEKPEHHIVDVRPEFVLLGFLLEKPAHGYELYKRFHENLAGLWRISESQMYATLKRLEERYMVAGAPLEKGSAASRRVLMPTDAGRALFEAWIKEPSVCSPRVLRLEFLSRLYFARRLAPDTVTRLFDGQRTAVVESLERLLANRLGSAGGFEVTELALDFSEGQLRSALEWLDTKVRPVLID